MEPVQAIDSAITENMQPLPEMGMMAQKPPEPPELKNIAPDFEEKELREIGERVFREFTADDDSRRGWLDMHADWLKLFNQSDDAKNPPWEGASMESVPIVAEAVVQFHARALRAFFPNPNIIKCIPTGKHAQSKRDRAERVGYHMSWQLMVKDKRYKKDKDALLLSVPLHGSFLTKTYRDPVLNRNITRNVRAEDLVVNYGIGPRDIADVERKTEIIWTSVNQTKIYKEFGYFSDVGEPYKGGQKTEMEHEEERSQGVAEPALSDDHLPVCLLEQHTVLDLDGDGIAEPYIVTIDRQTRKVLRLQIRYEVDPQGNPLNDKAPIEYYDHYVFIPNPDGFYGLGMGFLLGKINSAVNKMTRQTVDAGTLQNVGNMSGFISNSLGVGKGEVKMQLGKFITTTASADELQKGVKQLTFPGPSQALVEMLDMMMKSGRALSSTPEALTGNTDKVMQPTTFLGLIEQATVLFSTVDERLIDVWASELAKHYRLNGKYLDEQEYFAVNDLSGTPQEIVVGRQDYAPDLMVMPVADPKMATEQQRMAKSDATFQTLIQNPLVAQDPAALYRVTRRRLEEIGTNDIDQVFPPPEQKQPQREDDPMIENVGALLPVPMMADVFADQNHLQHLKAHDSLIRDPEYGPMLTPEGQQAIMAHRQKHVALMYAVTETPMARMLDGQGRGGPMGPAGNDTAIPSGPGGEVQPGQPMGGGGGFPQSAAAQRE